MKNRTLIVALARKCVLAPLSLSESATTVSIGPMKYGFCNSLSRKQLCGRRRGFALMMALVLILVAAISLVSFTRSSFHLARRAGEESENLQRKWGTYSCQTVLLGNPEFLFENSYSTNKYLYEPWPLAMTVFGTVELGGCQFEFQLADECAKVNLNSIFSRRKQDLNNIVSSLTDSSPNLTANILQPPNDSKGSEIAPFRSWGQIFEATESLQPPQLVDEVQKMSANLTCWGAGKLNIRRASDASLLAFCDSELSSESIKKLLSLRKEPGEKSLAIILSRMALRSKDRAAASRLLTDESNCYSLWVTCRNEQRSWTKLFALHPGDGSGIERVAFTW